ncbi:hypothetical protein MSHOH_0028 [Methanosarcina horonobensis HB-1 = JCM 15518]|uniref:Uncharacterized protein n=1 Tax=Methanosarcina horonobensis HB-1 = JCM 15518 TaxID=1434110 RepID=A0A0E3S7K3_9EURY|nr:hypothetical protein MSHOH_0028 [Methanosarcina horonobensis HB-1 = JCM 15518]
MKNNGVVTVAADGVALYNDFGKTSVEALNDFQVLGVYLQKTDDYSYPESDRYALEFDEDATRLAVENVLIAPCCGGTPIEDDTPDLLIKLKNLNYNGANPLPKGEYYLFVHYTLDNGEHTYYTALDCIRIMY